MSANPPFNTSFPMPTDVDAYPRPSRDVDGYGATTLTAGTFAAAPNCGPAALRNLATPAAPAITSIAGTAPAATAGQPQPSDPSIV